MKDYPKFFCPLPWVHQATYTDGSHLLCCVAQNNSNLNVKNSTFSQTFHSDFWNRARQEMLLGRVPSSCERCKVEEDNGYKSHRLIEQEVWERRLGKDVILGMIDQTDWEGGTTFQPLSLDLRIGNTCNLACVMCRPQDSIKWFALSQKMYGLSTRALIQNDLQYKSQIKMSDFQWDEDSKIWDELESLVKNGVQEIIIGGGEPMLLSHHFKFLNFCVTQGLAPKIHLRYHTNLTLFKKEFLGLWENFKEVEFFVSLDGIESVNSYVRFPAKWSDIKDNLIYLDSLPLPNIKIMLLHSAHFLNTFYLPDFYSWIESMEFKKVSHGFNGLFHPGIVMEPQFLSVQIYPKHIKSLVTEKILAAEAKSKNPSQKIEGLINFMNQEDRSQLLDDTLEFVSILDTVRGTSFKKSLPELYHALEFK